jgi:adenylate cyclase
MDLKPQELTVGFADIIKFSSIVQTLGEVEAIDLLQQFYETAGNSIVDAGGTLLKLIGDSILFYFSSGNELIALNCTKEIVLPVKNLSFDINVGLASGTVYTGQMGHQTCKQFELMGDTVNIAARLCNLGGIVVDRRTIMKANMGHNCEEILIKVSGKERKVFRFRG